MTIRLPARAHATSELLDDWRCSRCGRMLGRVNPLLLDALRTAGLKLGTLFEAKCGCNGYAMLIVPNLEHAADNLIRSG